jgi:D-glycero-alpha-D-manno-heptose-7-phosphate kinase
MAGGGTDISAYSHRFGGAVLNATIDRYAYAFISPRTDGRVHFSARDLNVEDESTAEAPLDQAKRLGLHRAVYNRIVTDHLGGEPLAVSIVTTVDAPMGAGLLGPLGFITISAIKLWLRHFDNRA